MVSWDDEHGCIPHVCSRAAAGFQSSQGEKKVAAGGTPASQSLLMALCPCSLEPGCAASPGPAPAKAHIKLPLFCLITHHIKDPIAFIIYDTEMISSCDRWNVLCIKIHQRAVVAHFCLEKKNSPPSIHPSSLPPLS